MGIKPEHSRPITQEEFIQLCIILLSMIDPASYVTIEPVDRKVTAKAKEYRSQYYVTIKQIIDADVQKQRRSTCLSITDAEDQLGRSVSFQLLKTDTRCSLEA
eukprot:4137006-Amphidinium_carterae.1